MKKLSDIQAYFLLLAIGIICLTIYKCVTASPKVSLPEEAGLITVNDTLKGYYDNNGTLHIEFNNKRNQ